MKKKWFKDESNHRTLFKWIRVMKLTLFFLLAIMMHVSASVYSQQTKLSISMRDVTVKEVLKQIEEQSEFFFLYKNVNIDVNRIVTVDIKEKSIEIILDQLFSGTTVSYEVVNRQIVLVDKAKENSLPDGQKQQKTIDGKVSDSSGTSLPGVSVVVKGTTTGVITDSNGKYSLSNIPESATLQFSFVGMKLQEIKLAGQTSINVTLVEETIGIEEVVAVGYGTQKRINLTGAVSTVTGEEMTKRPVANTRTMLQGQIAGLRVTSDRGQPGAETVQYRIRGQGTYSVAGSDPLILINGIEGDLGTLDPNIIENVSVLKDAASASIYGARAANGVILVTTKNGSQIKDRTVLTYRGNFAIYEPTRLLDNLVWDSPTYMKYVNIARQNSFINGGASPVGISYSPEMIDAYTNPANKEKYPSFNWLNYLFNPAFVQQHNLNVAGSTGKTSYNVSFNALDQPGTMLGMGYKRYNASVDLTSEVNSWIKFGAYFSGSYDDRFQPRNGDTDQYLSGISQAPTYAPWLPDDGSGITRWVYKAYPFEQNNKNVGAIVDSETMIKEQNTDVNFQSWLELKLAKGLTWHTKGGIHFQATRYKDWRTVPLPTYYTQTYTNPTTGVTINEGDYAVMLNTGGNGLDDRMTQTSYYTLYSNLKYDWASSDMNHKASIMAGYSIEQNRYDYLTANRLTYTYNLQELRAGASAVQTNDGYSEVWALMSGYARLNYSYKDRYLVELNTRYDGTSRIAPETRWGVFPSGSIGWRFTEEQWIKSLNLKWLNKGKIRGSYGILGNQNISLYSYFAKIAISGLNYPYDNTNLTTGAGQTALSNRNLAWETTAITDAGFDLTLIRGLNITFDWYNKKTYGILSAAQTSSLLGLSAPLINKGEMVNKGVELSAQYSNTINRGKVKGLEYTGGFYIERTRNEVTKYDAQEIGSGVIRKQGLPYNEFYTFNAIGIFNDDAEVASSPKQWNDKTLPGDIKYLDVNKDGKVDDNDRMVVKGRFPDLEYSVNMGVNWKGFDFSAMGQGVYGVKQWAQDWGLRPFYQGSPVSKDYINNMWTPENPNGSQPRLYFGDLGGIKNTRESSFWLFDGSYFRVKNVTIGYTIPVNFSRRFKVNMLRLYFSGDNLLLFTKFPTGGDPERNYTSSAGTRLVYYPQNKIYSFGINVEF